MPYMYNNCFIRFISHKDPFSTCKCHILSFVLKHVYYTTIYIHSNLYDESSTAVCKCYYKILFV